MKKIFAVLLAALMCMAVFTACKKEDAVSVDTYTGVLTKVRLGMPMAKIIALNSGHDLYYDSDTEIWCVNTDTDLMEIAQMIPEGDLFHYVDDSLITYSFKLDEASQENYLTAYQEEVTCLLDRADAEKYYNEKVQKLVNKYSVPPESIYQTITGTEDVDMTLISTTTMGLSSFEVQFIMEMTFDTVDGVEGYYGTYYSIRVKELNNKTAVEVTEAE